MTQAAAGPTVESNQQPKVARFAALSSRNFRLLWFGMLLSNAGTWMAATAEGWLVTDLKPGNAAFWLGVIAIVFAIPMIVLPPVGGAVADRVSRVRMLWIVQSLYLTMSVVLAIALLLSYANVWALVLYSFGNGVVLAFDSPARHALLPDIVTREQLTSGVSLNSVAYTGASLVGPAIAGPLIPLIGVEGIFVINAVSCFATLLALAMFRDVVSTHQRGAKSSGIFTSILDGVRHVRSVRVLAGIMLLSTAYSMFARSYGPMLAVFARDVFGVGSAWFGLLLSVGGLGTLVGAFSLASRGDVARKGHWVIGAMLVHGVLLLAFASLGIYWAGILCLLSIGLLSAIAGALMSTIIQLSVPNELRGRVMSIFVLTLVGVPSIGSFVIGGMAEALGPQLAVSISAGVTILAVALIASRYSELRQA